MMTMWWAVNSKHHHHWIFFVRSFASPKKSKAPKKLENGRGKKPAAEAIEALTHSLYCTHTLTHT
jgi:hypothetical protein